MRDLADIDRTLGELGQATQDVKGLLERTIGADRSLDRLDAMLGELAPGAPAPAPAPTPAPTPARQVLPGRHARWSRPVARAVEWLRGTSEPARVAAVAARESEPTGQDKPSRATLVGIPSRPPVPMALDGAVQAVEGEAQIGRSGAQVAVAVSFESRDEPAHDEPELSRQSEDTDPEIELSPQPEPEAVETDTETGSWQRPERSASAAQIFGFDAPEHGSAADADAVTRISTPPQEESTTTRFDARSLLDQQLDPADFAKEGAAQQPATAEAQDESEDDFELLIDDEEILEIEELE